MEDILFVLFNFIAFSFLGWIVENLYAIYKTKLPQKEGFLVGPFKPMYGIAMTLLIIYYDYLKVNNILLILLCFMVTTLVEYLGGVIFKDIFNKTFWDYSKFKYNFKGHITLHFSIYWVILSYIGIKYISPLIDNIFYSKLNVWIIGVPVVLIVIISDIYFTAKDLFERRIFT